MRISDFTAQEAVMILAPASLYVRIDPFQLVRL
jgi:hypothetical protein